MADARVEATIITEVPETGGWYAWNDLMPPKPDFVHVIGEVRVSNPGVDPELTYREPQGVNPSTLLLDLHLVQKPGIWPDVLVTKAVRYTRVLGPPYSRAVVFSGSDVIASMAVDDIHLSAGSSDAFGASAKTTMQGGEAPFAWSGQAARSGENPFPWASRGWPLCLTGIVSRIELDLCMDSAGYRLSASQNLSIRVRAANNAVNSELAKYAGKRLNVTVCGHTFWSTEGCLYLLAMSVEPAAAFSARLNA